MKPALAILCGVNEALSAQAIGLARPLGDESIILRYLRLFKPFFEKFFIVVHSPVEKSTYQEHLAGCKLNIEIIDSNIEGLPPGSRMIRSLLAVLSRSGCDRVIATSMEQVGVRLELLNKLAEYNKSVRFQTLAGESFALPSLWSKSDLEKVVDHKSNHIEDVKVIQGKLSFASIDPGDWVKLLEQTGATISDRSDFFGRSLLDKDSRRMHYLRFSLTEACNLSCTYCLPDGYPEWYRHRAKLSFPEVLKILDGFRRMGFRKVRFTGGEPTIHPRFLDAIKAARDLGFETIAMTTNGLLLEGAEKLYDAGLSHINISLDSTRENTFYQLTKSRHVEKVLDLIESCINTGVVTKINTVLLRTVNFNEMEDLIYWALNKSLTLRFIELMPTGLNQTFFEKERILSSEVIPVLKAVGLSQSVNGGEVIVEGPATVWQGPFLGKIGLISPLSCSFCHLCNRLRISAKGRLRLCLFGDGDLPIDLQSACTVERDVRKYVSGKAGAHRLLDGEMGDVATFRNIGG